MSIGIKNIMENSKKAITRIEWAIAIFITIVVTWVLFPHFQGYFTRAKNTRATNHIRDIRFAITQLSIDTQKWPHGCPVNQSSFPEVSLYDPQAWLMTRPTDFTLYDGCQWWQTDTWQWPYIQTIPLDPWWREYLIDFDYIVCDAVKKRDISVPVIVSLGKNGIENYPDCAHNGKTDDIFIVLNQ
jgi:hypothetical protein